MSLLETAIALSRAEARRLLEAPPLIDREREILGEVGREEKRPDEAERREEGK